MKEIRKVIRIVLLMSLMCQGVSANSLDYKTIYQNKIKTLDSLSNIDVTAQYIAEVDGNHKYPELIVAAIERDSTGMPMKYPFYIFTIENGKLIRLKNETDVFSGSDMGGNVDRYIVTNKKGDALIKEVLIDGPFLDCNAEGKYNTCVSTKVTYLKYIPNKGLTVYLDKQSYMVYDNDKLNTSGKGRYVLNYVNCNGEEISESKYNQLLADYK